MAKKSIKKSIDDILFFLAVCVFVIACFAWLLWD